MPVIDFFEIIPPDAMMLIQFESATDIVVRRIIGKTMSGRWVVEVAHDMPSTMRSGVTAVTMTLMELEGWLMSGGWVSSDDRGFERMYRKYPIVE